MGSERDELIQRLIDHAQEFCDRVDRGEVRSITTYNKFKSVLDELEPDKNDEELEFLRWFYSYSDFGPADHDVRVMLHEQYEKDAGSRVPDGYMFEEDE